MPKIGEAFTGLHQLASIGSICHPLALGFGNGAVKLSRTN